MKLKGKKVLITGADGFIGSHLVERCVKAGAKVRALVYYNSFNTWGWLDTLAPEGLKKIEVVAGDVRDFGSVYAACQGMDVVFHLAALISIPYSYVSPESYMTTNITGTTNILQASRILGVKKIVHTSTSEVYGTAQQVPIPETHPINAQSPYAASKSAADSLALSFYRSFDLPVVILRPFNTFGPRQSARAVIPTIISQILAGRKVVRLGNLDATRDLNYVGNTVEAFIRLAEIDKGLGEVYNTGSGSEVSIRDLAAIIQKILKKNVRIEIDPSRIRPAKSEVERLVCDAAKLTQLTGWEPEISLEDGLGRTCEWVRQNLNHFKTDIYNV
ncbi:MAG: SDR family NAD(P)-dependent oxidoreductase [Candidatus Omnitrophica bacterium]|nr:SDR family NAD(P)-dependent oxidoreductase [Candidatus Omnitrophota bacterium]